MMRDGEVANCVNLSIFDEFWLWLWKVEIKGENFTAW